LFPQSSERWPHHLPILRGDIDVVASTFPN
jgi:hypothetical protein